MTVQSTVLKDVAMVMLNISVWSGAKKLEPSDFINVDVDDLPSSRVASYGIKHLIEKERLQPFKTIRGQAERICSRYGTRLLGGYAIPQDCVDAVGIELQALCAKFEDEIETFMQQYADAISDWIGSNPDFAEPLRRAMLPRAQVKSRFKASFSIFEVSASPRDKTNSLASVGSELLDSVLLSVLTAIKPQLERKSNGATPDWFRVEVRQTISEAAQKMRRFAFCDRSGGMVKLADELEASVVGTGKIHGPEFDRLWSIIGRFTSLDAMKQAIELRAQTALAQVPQAPAADTPATIKDDLGFPLGDFATVDDTVAAPVQADTESELDTFSFEAEPSPAAEGDNEPTQVVLFPITTNDVPAKFADTFDF